MNGRKDTAGMSTEGGCKSAGRVSVGAAINEAAPARTGGGWRCCERGESSPQCVCVCMVSAPSTPLPYLLGSGHVPVKGTTYLFSTAL